MRPFTSIKTCYEIRQGQKKLPVSLLIRYTLNDDEMFTRKDIAILDPNQATIDRLEVERFSLAGKASFGGRGQPIFSNGWFFGLESFWRHRRGLWR